MALSKKALQVALMVGLFAITFGASAQAHVYAQDVIIEVTVVKADKDGNFSGLKEFTLKEKPTITVTILNRVNVQSDLQANFLPGAGGFKDSVIFVGKLVDKSKRGAFRIEVDPPAEIVLIDVTVLPSPVGGMGDPSPLRGDAPAGGWADGGPGLSSGA